MFNSVSQSVKPAGGVPPAPVTVIQRALQTLQQDMTSNTYLVLRPNRRKRNGGNGMAEGGGTAGPGHQSLVECV